MLLTASEKKGKIMDTTCLSDPVHQKIRKPIMTGSGGKPKDTRSATGGSDKKSMPTALSEKAASLRNQRIETKARKPSRGK